MSLRRSREREQLAGDHLGAVEMHLLFYNSSS